MKVFINENIVNLLSESLEYAHVSDAKPEQDEYIVGIEENALYNSYRNKIEIAKTKLEDLIKHGTIMQNIENNKTYLVYYNDELSNLIGKKICICSVIQDNNKIHPTVYVKPMDVFKTI